VGKYNNGKSDSNDSMTFTTVTEEKEKGKDEKQTCLASNVKRKGTTPMNAPKKLPATSDKKGTSLLINKEDSSDKEIEDEQYEAEKEDTSMTPEEYQM